MKLLDRVKKDAKIMALCVICLALTTIGVTYSIFFSVKANTNNQTITTGTLSVAYGSSSTSITNNEIMPMTDTEGMAQTSNALIYVQNNGSLNSSYTITIGYDYAAFTGRSGYATGDELVPLENLRLALYEYDVSDSSLTLLGGVINLGDLPIYTMDSNNNYNNTYVIYYDNVQNSSSGNNAKTFAVKVWLSDTSQCISGYYIDLKINIVSGVTESKMNYTVSGTLKDSTDAAVSGATISLQNNSSTATTSSTGAFSLANVREGIYLVNITSGSNTYSGVLRVIEGSTKSVSRYAQSHTAVSGNTLSGLAYTYSTTVNRIISANSLTTSSTDTTLSPGTSYTIPSGFALTGGTSSALGGLTITLGTDSNIGSMSVS